MITATELKGIIVPIVTPVTEEETVDYEGLRRVVRHVLDGGVHGVFALGGTGNFCSFTAEERFEVARTVVQEVKGQSAGYRGWYGLEYAPGRQKCADGCRGWGRCCGS